MTPDETTRIEFAEKQGKCTHPFEFLKSETIEDGNDSDTNWTCTKCNKDPHENTPPDPTDANHVRTALMGMSEDEWFMYFIKVRAKIGDSEDIFSIIEKLEKLPLSIKVECFLAATKERK